MKSIYELRGILESRVYRSRLGRYFLRGENFECPICLYTGPFAPVSPSTGKRLHAQCPACGSSERQRLQYLVLSQLLPTWGLGEKKILHFAPEPFFRNWFLQHAKSYETADLFMKGVDHQVDITSLPFSNDTYDVVFASHVLEHVTNDRLAIAEIFRVLRPGGCAILPVPIVTSYTVEYPEPNPFEANHVRAPGVDYFDRYKACFSVVDIFTSANFDEKFQPYIYEDRNNYDKNKFQYRSPMAGIRHLDYVPVCIK